MIGLMMNSHWELRQPMIGLTSMAKREGTKGQVGKSYSKFRP
jgi:hypothetical protein